MPALRLNLAAFLLALPLVGGPPSTTLQKYAGIWQVSRKSAPGKTEALKNQCVAAGTYFVCQQSSNGVVSGLLILTPAALTNHFNTQNVLPDGRATGKGELVIDGSKWVFNSTWNGGGPITRYRTTDTFVTSGKIQFTQEESTDGSHWTLKDSGEEVRTPR